MKKSQIAGILFGAAMGVLFSVSMGTVGFVLGASFAILGMVMFNWGNSFSRIWNWILKTEELQLIPVQILILRMKTTSI